MPDLTGIVSIDGNAAVVFGVAVPIPLDALVEMETDDVMAEALSSVGEAMAEMVRLWKSGDRSDDWPGDDAVRAMAVAGELPDSDDWNGARWVGAPWPASLPVNPEGTGAAGG